MHMREHPRLSLAAGYTMGAPASCNLVAQTRTTISSSPFPNTTPTSCRNCFWHVVETPRFSFIGKVRYPGSAPHANKKKPDRLPPRNRSGLFATEGRTLLARADERREQASARFIMLCSRPISRRLRCFLAFHGNTVVLASLHDPIECCIHRDSPFSIGGRRAPFHRNRSPKKRIQDTVISSLTQPYLDTFLATH